jgi:4a-hydroxytetrahydrobiopterin dehydratase
MPNNLLKKMCVACEGKGIKPFDKAQAEEYLSQVEGWTLDQESKKISKEYKFKDFIGAINFVNKISEIAESEGHHPDIHINYNKVRLELSTHAIGGLSENDFIVAAKVDASN